MSNSFILLTVLGTMIGFTILVILALMSGHRYSVHDTETHATQYAGIIKEGHGGITIFLWTCYAVCLSWTIYYFIKHSHEFALIFSSR
jgi:hypothetical protein